MTKITEKSLSGDFTLSAYQGDAKTLLAFNLEPTAIENLAGFSIYVQPPKGVGYYLINNLQFEKPEDHAQIKDEAPNSTANAPIHKFRWVHVPGLDHQGALPEFGTYAYTVTPRYFDEQGHMQPIDKHLSATVKVAVGLFKKGTTQVGFTRGYVQSQAYVHRYGNAIPTRPRNGPIIFDTSQVGGAGPNGKTFTFSDQYKWLGFSARKLVFEVLDLVIENPSLKLGVFAYDLNEPDIMKILLKLASEGRVRVILDDADLHHDKKAASKPEDEFEAMFRSQATGKAGLIRGYFGRYAHDKILIVYQDEFRSDQAIRVLTGSTNFSVTGLYVNSNHVLVFDDPEVARKYGELFDDVWTNKPCGVSFSKRPLAQGAFPFTMSSRRPEFNVSYSPRTEQNASDRLNQIISACNNEANRPDGNVFFAVMEMSGKSPNPVYQTLNSLNSIQNLFSYGISDNPAGVSLYPQGKIGGVLTTGRPGRTLLPHPFDKVPSIGLGHQIHHKFVVCGFGREDAVVIAGSSNLAFLGEQKNGDNLLFIKDPDIASAFVIEAILLVDHFNFLDRLAAPKDEKPVASAQPVTVSSPSDKRKAAVKAKWFLGTTDLWAKKYYQANTLHYKDRLLFA